eukprot:403367758
MKISKKTQVSEQKNAQVKAFKLSNKKQNKQITKQKSQKNVKQPKLVHNKSKAKKVRNNVQQKQDNIQFTNILKNQKVQNNRKMNEAKPQLKSKSISSSETQPPLFNRFENKICLISGGTKGIGLATAKRFAQEGGTVIISSSQQKSVDEVKKEIKEFKNQIEAVVCDIGNSKQRTQLINHVRQKYGRIDVLFLNAAVIEHRGNQLEITEEQFDRTIDVNLKGLFFMIKEAKPLMPKGSNILLTSSMGAFDPFYQIGLYAMTKAAVNNLVKSLVEELKPDKIRINAVAPGLVQTELAAPLIEQNPHLINQSAKPEQIASFVATVCSEDGSWLNGECYIINGGWPKL